MADRVLLAFQKRRRGGRFVRLINCHDMSRSALPNFRRQMEFFTRHFTAVTEDDLQMLLAEGRWEKSKPGLLISFDDGLRSNYDVATPLLEDFGFRDWFFVPLQFIDTPVSEQVPFARAHQIFPAMPSADGRLAMGWDEVRDLRRRGHVIGCHTRTHKRLDEIGRAHV